jgi:hypothetical protein
VRDDISGVAGGYCVRLNDAKCCFESHDDE